MQHIQGISRNQLQMGSLEDKITADNPVRFIEAFVKTILNNFKKSTLVSEFIKEKEVEFLCFCRLF